MQSTSIFAVLVGLGFSLSASGAPPTAIPVTGSAVSPATDTTLTPDPLTGLPVYPATVCSTSQCTQLKMLSGLVKAPDTKYCKSSLQSDAYLVFGSTVDATLAWYASHLPGFKRTHAYADGHSDDMFYNSAGTVFVIVMGNRATDGENTDTDRVVYYRLQPGLRENAIIAFNRLTFVCS